MERWITNLAVPGDRDPILEIEVPGEPMPWARPRFKRLGPKKLRFFTSPKVARYQETIEDAVRVLGPRAATGEPLTLWVKFGLPIPESKPKRWRALAVVAQILPIFGQRNDLDNFVKGVMDAISHAGNVWVDDCQVVDLACQKRYSLKPSTTIVVTVHEKELPC